MNDAARWASAIGLPAAHDSDTLLPAVIGHIRDAVIDAGYVSRGRITSGLKEAYRPLGIDETVLRGCAEEALRVLLLIGDIDEFTTGAGRGYAPTPPRLVDWGEAQARLLGSIPVSEPTAVRRIDRSGLAAAAAASVDIRAELGRPAWRDALVELGGADAPDGSPSELTNLSRSFASSGSRYSLDEPMSVAVLAGRSDYFGNADPPTGRWQRVKEDGFFPAFIRAGYATRYVVLEIRNAEATSWQPPSRDVWNWIVVGQTLDLGDPVFRYDRESGAFDFLTPPPRQAERTVLLTGQRTGRWSWIIDEKAYAIVASLMGRPR